MESLFAGSSHSDSAFVSQVKIAMKSLSSELELEVCIDINGRIIYLERKTNIR